MGKSRRSSRSKGNTRPSSSGHTAELLNTTGLPVAPGFLGFQNYPKDTLGLKVRERTLSDDADLRTDDGITSMIMKKMLKRDAVTKLKAVQEFMDFCSGDHYDAKSMVPFWPRLFSKLALDSDKRVRESVHKANELLILKVKRAIAPVLKGFMGVWLITQCDTHRPAATAARHAFSSAFPQSKQSEALMFCHSEILKMLQHNIFSLTPDSFTEIVGMTDEECKEKYLLMMPCTLYGMRLFVSLLAEDDKMKIVDDVTTIVTDQRFWIHAQSKIPQVRTAWYSLILTLCRDIPVVFTEAKQKLIESTMCSLYESDGSVAYAIWKTAIQVIISFQDWWHHINVHKVMLPHLWKFLKHGGMGHAVLVYPCLCLMLSMLSKETTGTGVAFYKEFFSSIRESFTLSRLKTTASDCDAVVKAFVQCLQHSVSSVYSDPDYDPSIVEHLISGQLIPLVRSSLAPEGLHVAKSSFYKLLGQYLQHIENQACFGQLLVPCSDTVKGEIAQNRKIVNLFWDDAYWEIINILNMEHSQHCENISTVAIFLRSIYEPAGTGQLHDESRDSDFDKTSSDSDETDTTPASDTYPSYGSGSVACENSIAFECIAKICGYLCLKVDYDLPQCCIKLLAELIPLANCSKLYFELLTILRQPVKEIADAPRAFFEKVLLNWAKRSNFEELSLDCIGDIIISICFCLNKQSALDLLDVCSKFECQKLYTKLIVKTLKSETNTELFDAWFRTPVFGGVFKTMIERFIKQVTIAKINIDWSQIQAYHTTILECIPAAITEAESRIPRKYVDIMLDACLAFLLSNPNYIANENVEAYSVIDLASEICGRIIQYSAENLNFRNLESLLFHLFLLSLDCEKYNLSVRQKKNICAVWEDSIANLALDNNSVHLNEYSFVSMASDHIHNLLQMPLSEKMRNHVLTVATAFLMEIEDAYYNKSGAPIFSLILQKIFPSFDEWEELKKELKLSTVPSILKGKWFYPIESEDCSPICPMVLPQLIFTAEITSELLHRFLGAEGRGKPDEILVKLLFRHFPHFLWAMSYIESVEYFKIQTEKKHPVISNFHEKCEKLIALLKEKDMKELVNDLFDLSLCDGMTWAIPFEKIMQSPAFHSKIKFFIPEVMKQIKNGGRPCVNKCSKFCTCCDTDHAVRPNRKYFAYPKTSAINEMLNEFTTVQVCLRNSINGFSAEFLQSVRKDFFNIETSSPREPEYFGVLAEVSFCVQRLSALQVIDNQEQILGFLQDLIKYHRFFGSNENEGLVFVINFTAISSVVLRDVPDIISCDMWYSIFELIMAWFQQCKKIAVKALKNSSALIFMQQTCTLICIVSHLFAKKEAYHEVGEYYSLPVNAKWHQLFHDHISYDLTKLYVQISENLRNLHQSSDAIESLMIMLSQAVEYLSDEQILKPLLPFHYGAATWVDSKEMTDNLYKVLRQLMPSLMSKSLALQFGIHSILTRIVVNVPKLLRAKIKDVSKDDDNDDDDDAMDKFKSFPLVEVLYFTNDIVEAMLADIKLGKFCVLEPYTSAYTYTVAYLMTWTELLEYFSATFSEERCMYTACLEENKLLTSLLMNLLRLIPRNPGVCFGHIKSESTVKKHEYQSIFAIPPPICSLDEPCHRHVQHMASSLYCRTLKKVPALVRTWWNNLDKKDADFVQKFTRQNISGLIIMSEMSVVKACSVKFSNLTVKAHPASNEVTATYTVDDSAIELSIRLPSNYPLSPIVADSRRKLGVGQAQWRNWLLQLSSFLNYHNGSIIDALALWKKNLDKKFEGVEECMICFFILHNATCKLPALSCSTCKKKFHSTCLYKWFNTSNNSTCPSCRNYF